MITPNQIFNFYNQKLKKYYCNYIHIRDEEEDHIIISRGDTLEIKIIISYNYTPKYLIHINDFNNSNYSTQYFLTDEQFLEGLYNLENIVINSII